MTLAMEELSGRAVRAFVQSVLAVDDNITMDPEAPVDLEKDNGTGLVATPPSDVEPEPYGGAERDEGMSASPAPAVKSTRGGLQGAALTDAFAREGIVCGLLSTPERDNILAVAKRADVLIMDWDLGDNGELAREVIRELTDLPAHSDGRPAESLRLVVIYTNESPETVDVSLQNHLTGVDPQRVGDGGLRFENGLIVDVLRKGTAPDGTPAADVPKEVFRRLARAVPGLVQAAALQAIAALRTNTHRLINAFPQELDLGYVGHRAALAHKEEAVSQVVGVIADEMRALLEDDQYTANAVGPDAVAAWLSAQAQSANWPRSVVCGGKARPRMSPSVLAQWVEWDHAVKRESDVPDGWLHASRTMQRDGRLTELIAGDELARTSDPIWACALSQRRVYADEHRQLTLGTIVTRRPANGSAAAGPEEWLVCLQPVCDSVRITDEPPHREFLLLPMAGRESGDDINVFDGVSWVGLSWQSTKTYHLTADTFAANSRGQVMAEADHILPATSGRHTYLWAAQLNATHAQRVANGFAAKLGRAGVDESEWQRLR